jgi:hypothetical protein
MAFQFISLVPLYVPCENLLPRGVKDAPLRGGGWGEVAIEKEEGGQYGVTSCSGPTSLSAHPRQAGTRDMRTRNFGNE